MKVFNINDSYFKYQKCLSGITYQFVNQLDNIYEKNLMVGTNYCIYCMYNEFDIINNFMINLYHVDVCSIFNLDLTKKYYEIDGAQLRTGHRILLVNQDNPIENDIYQVDSRGYLILTDELSDTSRNWRYKAYVKLGNNKGKQYHLVNSGNRFPLTGERKYFLDGHGYIIKSFFNYDINNSGTIIPKIIFTDYELARISVNKNYELYNKFLMPYIITGDTVDIQYHQGNYLITVDDDTSKFIYSGVTSGDTIYNYNDLTEGFGYETYIQTDSIFCSNASVYDYINFEISGSTSLYLKTFIKRIDSPYIIISDYISDNILNDFYTGYTSNYTVTNLMYSTQSTIKNTILDSFYSKYFTINDSNEIVPIENVENKYFDYDGLIFVFSGNSLATTQYFQTNNYYINYKLYEHLNKINSYLFNSGYSFLTYYNMPNSAFRVEYYDEQTNYFIYSSNWDTKGTLIKIIPSISSDVNYFKKYTYVNLLTSSGVFKTLIVDLVPNEYFIIESYKANSGITSLLTSVETLYNLKDISDILYDVYINDETPTNIDYYRVREDATRRNICNSYASFISEDLEIINYVTAFLMQNEQNKFILKIYDPENLYNGGVIRAPYVVTKGGAIVTASSAILPGEIINDGGSNITSKGVCYSGNQYFTSPICVTAATFGDNIGPFTVNAYPLTPLKKYWYKAFAQNEQGYSYGEPYYFTTSDPIYTGATVINMGASVIKSHEMILNGDVIDKGYLTIEMRGFVYQTGLTTPTTDDNIIVWTNETGEIGLYSINVTGLTHDTLYSYNAFAINACGTTYGDMNSGYTLYPYPPDIRTIGHENLTYQSFNALANLVDNDGDLNDPIHGVDNMGIVWTSGYTNPPMYYDNPTPYSGTIALGNFIVPITGLSYNTAYYYRAFAINSLYSGDTTSYGVLKTLTTLPLPVAPTLNSEVLNYSTYSANIYNNIISDGGSPIISLGLYFATGTTVNTGNTFWHATGTTSWTTNLTGLTPVTQYSVMSEAINNFGTGYSYTGFTTLPIQTLPVVQINFLYTNETGSTLSGNIADNGNSFISSKGILYTGATLSGWLNWFGGTGNGIWTSNITGLTASSQYYAKSYATNEIGTSYSDTITWSTISGLYPPVFSPESPINQSVGVTNAKFKNIIISDGGAPVTYRGLLYSGSTTPGWIDIYGGTGTGEYDLNITGLTSGVDYYVKGHATNSEGTTYTPTTGFTTLTIVAPTVVINSVTNITTTGATVNSQITNNGNDTILERGTTGDTIGYWKASLSGGDYFSINLTGLTQNESYNINSYAINSIATGWSSDYNFTTLQHNNASIKMNLSAPSHVGNDATIYEVGSLTSDLITSIQVYKGNLLISELWTGMTYFTAPSPIGSPVTGLTWANGVESANNSKNPYTFAPTSISSYDFVAIESCGTPSVIKSDIINIQSIYPFLTCNRTPEAKPNGPIPSEVTLRTWASNGSFYTGNMPPNYLSQPMLKKIEIKSNKLYSYNISNNNLLVYFSYPSSYGTLTSIIVNGSIIPLIGPGAPTIYTNVQMTSVGLANNWSGVLYQVYAFIVNKNLGNIYIGYYF